MLWSGAMRTLLLLALTAAACGGADLRPRPSPRQIVRASGRVQIGDAWPHAYLLLQDRLGPPTRAGDGRYLWAASLGPDCYLIEVAVRGGVVVYVDDCYRATPAGVDGYARCRAAVR